MSHMWPSGRKMHRSWVGCKGSLGIGCIIEVIFSILSYIYSLIIIVEKYNLESTCEES